MRNTAPPCSIESDHSRLIERNWRACNKMDNDTLMQPIYDEKKLADLAKMVIGKRTLKTASKESGLSESFLSSSDVISISDILSQETSPDTTESKTCTMRSAVPSENESEWYTDTSNPSSESVTTHWMSDTMPYSGGASSASPAKDASDSKSALIPF